MGMDQAYRVADESLKDRMRENAPGAPAPRGRLRHLPPTALPDRLSHSATSAHPAEHPHLPFHLPSFSKASYGDG